MEARRIRYIPALDGLRAFAVLAVIAYHMGFSWAKGGLLGVTMFFVLSGYLITGLLRAEYHSTSTINLPHFWLRRVRRLVPAIVTVIVVTAVLCTLFNHVLLTKMRPDIIPSLFFFSNWWQIFHDISYFEALGSPSPLQHFWSLAIEEQFYLIWPVLLLAVFRLNVKEKILRRGILVLALVSVIEMAVLYNPASDPSQVYYGTDTRAFSLLIGAWLSFVWPAGLLSKDVKIEPRLRWAFDALGLAAFAGLIAMTALTDGFSPMPYRGGILLCSLLTAALIAVIAHPASLLGRFWALEPLVWIGKRSYGMYLWHYPILLLMTDRNAASAAPLWWNALELAVIVGVSALSYKFIENPIRHGALGAWIRRVRAGEIDPTRWLRAHAIPAAVASVLALVAIGGVAFVPDQNALESVEELQQASEEQQAKREEALANLAESPEGTFNIVFIGDSICVGVAGDFELRFPQGLIDGEVSRQISSAQEVYDAYRDQGVVGNVVVFALGNNAGTPDDLLESLIQDVGEEKQIYFMTIRTPDTIMMDEVNSALKRAAQAHDNVNVIDWAAHSEGHDEWFHEDGLHPSPEGAEYYCDLIQESIGFPKVYDKTKDPNYASSFQDTGAAEAIENGEYTGMEAAE